MMFGWSVSLKALKSSSLEIKVLILNSQDFDNANLLIYPVNKFMSLNYHHKYKFSFFHPYNKYCYK